MTAQPIEIDYMAIRRGDEIRAVDYNTPFTVADIRDLGTPESTFFESTGVSYAAVNRGRLWDRRWELVSRPQPKPEVGQHWLDDNGGEFVVLETPNGVLLFYPLLRAQKPLLISADVAPDGWTLKP